MTRTATKNLKLSETEKASLRFLAREWGFTIGRGPMADEGSIDQLINELAHGGALWVPVAGDEEYLPAVVTHLRELARKEGLSILSRVATALERADQLYHDKP